jgi:hypothetical protein
MPSPFPGMDPFLEAPHILPDFHNAFASVIRGELNRTVPRPYYARLEIRPEVGIMGDANEPVRHLFIEIRDAAEGHKLITLIEIVSPSNKRMGPDRRAYQKKQREVLESDASLVEIDLLRHGERLPANEQLAEVVEELRPRPHYLVFVNRAWTRVGDVMGCQIFPIGVRQVLPCIPIPLRHEESEVLLDLQLAFNRAYDDGPYQLGAVDYARPPRQPLESEDARWAEELLRTAGVGTES